MARKTLIFGNGLGMALDPDFFRLDTAIDTVWDDDDLLDDASRTLIRQCLPPSVYDRPTGEHDLDVLQVAVFATDYLAGLKDDDTDGIHWLSEYGQRFAPTVRKFIHETADNFHNYGREIPDEFVDALADFLRETQSHIATLNYDNLLYQPLIDREILCGYDGFLVDGIWGRTGFAEKNLIRKRGRIFGYYLHLHGSPLFVDRGTGIYKLRQYEAAKDSDRLGRHIVLTHVDHKNTVIAGSDLLSAYWRYLWKAIEESEEIILFGYSGGDVHLNHVLREAGKGKEFRVVEWQDAHDPAQRTREWEEKIGHDVDLDLRENILTFGDW